MECGETRAPGFVRTTDRLFCRPATDGVWRRVSVRALLAACLSAALVTLASIGSASAQPISSNPLFNQQQQLTGSGVLEDAGFGISVALSADGVTGVVGGSREEASAGAAWIFGGPGLPLDEQAARLAGSEQDELEPEAPCGEEVSEASGECRFGRSVAISADGSTAIVGAPRANDRHGVAWVFTRTGSSWTPVGVSLTGESKGSAYFGRSVALSADGNTALVGAPVAAGGRGAVWIFTRSGSTWSHGEEIGEAPGESGPGHFGRSVALSADGNTALVGAPNDGAHAGAAWTLARSGPGSAWHFVQSLLAGAEGTSDEGFGTSVALSGDGHTALVGAPADGGEAGSVWGFAGAGGSFTQQGKALTGGEAIGAAAFGSSLALSFDGSRALIGGPHDNKHRGAAWAFTRSGSGWAQVGAKIEDTSAAGESRFGTSVTLSANGSVALLGEPNYSAGTGTVWALSGPAPPAPIVTSVTPSSGPSTGGTAVTIKGSGFLPGATVEIGSVAQLVNVISPSEITAQTGATPEGSYEVHVTDANGASAAGPLFTYITPPPPPVNLEPPPGGGTNPGTGTGSSGPNGTSTGAHSEVLGLSSKLPLPQLGVSGNLAPVSGRVYIKLPGSTTFARLTGARQVPFGTIVDATNGRVTVTTASAHGGLQSVTFYGGMFRLTQSRNGQVVATLVGGNFKVCPTAKERAHKASVSSAHASPKHVVRKLWAEGHGSYSTRGNYASGAVQGTRWLTEDLCEGTLIKVATDRVLVHDFVKHRNKTLRAPHSYLAHAPK